MATTPIEQESQSTWTVMILLGVTSGEEEAMLDLAEIGIPLSRLPLFTDLGLTRAEMHTLGIPPRTLTYRRSGNGRLTREESDLVLRVLRCLLQARRVFGNQEKALRWLREAKTGLGGCTPLGARETETRTRLVEEWLVRIDQGMAA